VSFWLFRNEKARESLAKYYSRKGWNASVPAPFCGIPPPCTSRGKRNTEHAVTNPALLGIPHHRTDPRPELAVGNLEARADAHVPLGPEASASLDTANVELVVAYGHVPEPRPAVLNGREEGVAALGRDDLELPTQGILVRLEANRHVDLNSLDREKGRPHDRFVPRFAGQVPRVEADVAVLRG